MTTIKEIGIRVTDIFVFGSNLAGRHGKGAARDARISYGAIYGQGEGPQGSSYGIPTKDAKLNVLPLNRIQAYVDNFIVYARNNPKLTFLVTRVGCGLAGYSDDDIKPFFKASPENCLLPEGWRE